MARRRISFTLLLLLIAQVNAQFFDFFGVQPVTHSPRRYNNDHSSIRTKVVRVPAETQTNWKNTTYSFSYDAVEKEDKNRESSREKKRLHLPLPTLRPIFNQQTTQKSVRKTAKVNTSPALSNHRVNIKRKNPTRDTLHDVESTKNAKLSDWYDRPVNNFDDNNKPTYEGTTKSYNNDYNNRVVYNTNDYTTKNPFYHRPGVKPVVVDNGPPITNKPVTQKPYRPEAQKPYRPQQTNKPETEKSTFKPTVKPYLVNPIPTQAGAVVFPHEDDPPDVIRGPDEDYMSETDKRRYIEMAEKMCDRYKSLNTKQLSAIPLLPSPEPVSVNVSQCTPTQIPLVVGGKVVTINEFPHMALLGWVKIDGGGYSWKCGGSLISDQYVLTAAHCSYEERDNTVFTGPPRVVQFGSSYMDDPGALVVRVAAIIRHPKYKFPRSYYDLAILKLIQPVTFSEVIKPACLGVPPAVDQPVIATGWGKTEFGGDQSVELRSVSLPVWDMDSCSRILGTSRKMPQGPQEDSQLCAGEKRGGKDTCQGDSGGPAQLQDGCVWRVVAVTSLGRSCGAPNTPGLYALVQRAFIAAAVFGNLKNNPHRADSYQNAASGSAVHQNSYTTQGYRTNPTTTTTESYYKPIQNGNRRTTTTTESYYNPVQNGNRRTTTTTESYHNPVQSGNRRMTTTESYYYPVQNSNRRTTTTESYYNPVQNNYRPDSYDTDYSNRQNTYRNTQSRRPLDTDAGFYEPQREKSNGQVHSQPQHDYWSNNRPQRDYSRRDVGRFEPGSVWFTK